jgi:flagellar basal-body rod modification protein FlgD
MDVSAYSSSSSVSSTTSSDYSSSLDMDDFLSLLVTQLTNQDCLDPTDSTEFISQLAEFTSLEAMTEISELTQQLQATSLIGKTVSFSSYNSSGILVTTDGVVEKVTISSGVPSIYVDGTSYELSEITAIEDTETTNEEQEILEDILDGIDDINSTLNVEE